VHPGDDFLTEVAPFGEGNTIGEDGGFRGETLGAEVDVVDGGAGLDAGDVRSGPSGGAEFDAVADGGLGPVDGEPGV